MAVPRILNNDPLVIPVPLSDPYYAYYFTGNDMGRFKQDDVLIFKFIGYNPDAPEDENSYTYDLTYLISNTTPTGAFSSIVSPVAPSTGTEGWLNGTLATIGASINQYSITVRVSKTSDPSSFVQKTFTFVLIGTISDTIEWVTPSDLGTIDNGSVSDFAILATFGTGITNGIYRLSSGNLPPGLQILNDGGISGRVEFNLSTYGTYTFTVEAYSPTYPTLVTSTKQFTLTVVQSYTDPYDTLYMKGLLTTDDRQKINNLLSNIESTQSANIYRPTDAYFGVAKDVKYQHQYGVRSVSDDVFFQSYIAAVQRNFYWKWITLGELKTAVAKDSNGNIIYEVVYSEIIDNLVTADGTSISKKVGFRNPIIFSQGSYWTSWETIYTSNTYYDVTPLAKQIIGTVSSSVLTLNNVNDLVVGMQVTGFPGVTITNAVGGIPPTLIAVNTANNTVTLSVSQTLLNKDQIIFNDPISTSNTDTSPESVDLYPNSLPNMREQIDEMIGQFPNDEIIPRWMTSQQSDGSVLGYVPCWVLCYTKAGKSADVLTGINAYLATQSLTLNQIGFELDRFEVDRSLTYTWGETTFEQWPSTPSESVNNNSQDVFINFPRKTIL